MPATDDGIDDVQIQVLMDKDSQVVPNQPQPQAQMPDCLAKDSLQLGPSQESSRRSRSRSRSRIRRLSETTTCDVCKSDVWFSHVSETSTCWFCNDCIDDVVSHCKTCGSASIFTEEGMLRCFDCEWGAPPRRSRSNDSETPQLPPGFQPHPDAAPSGP